MDRCAKGEGGTVECRGEHLRPCVADLVVAEAADTLHIFLLYVFIIPGLMQLWMGQYPL